MPDTYALTLEQEILFEQAADISGSLFQYMEKNNLTPDNSLAGVISKNIISMKNEIVGCKTMEELSVLRGQLDFIQKCLKPFEE